MWLRQKSRHKIVYPSLESAIRPVPHSDDLPIPVFRELETEVETPSTSYSDSGGSEVVLDCSPRQFSQADVNDLVRDLNLSKKASELLASRLRERYLLHDDVRISLFRTREAEFLQYFSSERGFVYCNNVEGLLAHLGLEEYNTSDWRLFIDSSKHSLKCVLLHNTNKYGAVPLGHSIHLKETYESVKTVIELLNYHIHNWIICVDLKMVNLLLGQQRGFTKYPCFICMWDSRDRKNHWSRKDWPKRKTFHCGDPNVVSEPIVSREKIIFPPLHIKLGIMKQFVKSLDDDRPCFKHIRDVLPAVSYEKVRAGIFDGPQIRQLLRDESLEEMMNATEKEAWLAFKDVIAKFLGNRRDEDYRNIVSRLLEAFKKQGCNMSIKIHFLFSHLDQFPVNLGDVSDEQGERFHQDLRDIEERYQGRWDSHMLADYCWSIKRDQPLQKHSRKSYKRRFLPA